MVDPIFREPRGTVTLAQLRALAIHYMGWRQNGATTLKSTSQQLGKPAQTLTTTWDALERHYGVQLFERVGKARSGRLTRYGQIVGLHALNFAAGDYLVRNVEALGDLGGTWASEYVAEINRQADYKLHMVSLLGDQSS